MISSILSFLDTLYFKVSLALSKHLVRVADFSEENLNQIKEGAEDGGMLSSFYSSAEMVGQDLYTTLMLIGGFGGVILLIIAFLFLATSGTGQKKEEAKSKIFVVLIGVAGVFASVFIVGLAMKIGNGISNAAGAE